MIDILSIIATIGWFVFFCLSLACCLSDKWFPKLKNAPWQVFISVMWIFWVMRIIVTCIRIFGI